MSSSFKGLLAGALALTSVATMLFETPVGAKSPAASKSRPMAIAEASDANEDPVVVVDTTKGQIKMRIFKKQAPITSNNFLDLVNRKFYDGLTFHRFVDGFVIQGGDPKGDGSGDFVDPKTHQKRTIKLEKVPGLTHAKAGTLAMARSTDPDSASCQWYITLAPQRGLDDPPGYAVFGQVIDGMDTVMKLRQGDKMTKVAVSK